ncbi:hypothetical protein OAC78_05585, partial [Litorivicinus sp.]|nr:hypothetical protein [Litorivicinus sp.]
MDRRGENLVRPCVLALGLHVIVVSSFFIAVSPEAKTIIPPQVIVMQATELTFAPSEAAISRAKKQEEETDQKLRDLEVAKQLAKELERKKLEDKKRQDVELKKKAETE